MHDTFERVAVIRPPPEVERNLNYAVVTVALAHNLDFEYPVDPYQCRNIRGLAKAVHEINKKKFNSNHAQWPQFVVVFWFKI